MNSRRTVEIAASSQICAHVGQYAGGDVVYRLDVFDATQL